MADSSFARLDATDQGDESPDLAKHPKAPLDLAGKTFAGIRVLRRCGTDSRGNSIWMCACTCGRDRIIQGRQIIRLKSARCLCVGATLQDLAGQKFGRLFVVESSGLDKRNRRLWLCRCDCGGTKILSAHKLLIQNVKSCGCIVRENAASRGFKMRADKVGKKFGRLTVVAVAEETLSTRYLKWVCLCECGNTHKVRSSALVSMTTISCGCANSDHPGLQSVNTRNKQSARTHNRRSRQRQTGGSFTAAEIDALHKRQRGRCAESTCRVKLGQKFHRDHVTPIQLGGTNYISNIQLLCPTCNLRKSDKDPLKWAAEMGRLL